MDGWWAGVNWWATNRWKFGVVYGNIDLDLVRAHRQHADVPGAPAVDLLIT